MTQTALPLVERSRRAVWHPCTQMKRHEGEPLLAIARGDGAWLVDTEGRRYLDAVSSWWVNLFGHNQPRIKAAIADQLERIEHVMLAGLTHEPVVLLSERLAALTGLGHAFYGSDGASATEIALKMSAHCWRNRGHAAKTRFVGLAGGYHGETVGALSVTDIALFRDAYGPLVRLSATVPSPDARLARDDRSAAGHAEDCAAALEAWLEEHHATTAALIVEPLVQCAAGMAMHDAHFLRRARALCDRYAVHLIADEIAVGFGRTGPMFASQESGVMPDLMCLSKGLTGGFLPLAAVLATQRIYDAFLDDSRERAFLHSHSYTGNPLACAAALATLDIFEQDDVLARNRVTSTKMAALAAPFASHPQVADVRQAGMVVAFELTQGGDKRTPFPAQQRIGLKAYRAALERGVVLRPLGDVLYWMPPYCIDDAQLQLMAEITRHAIDEAVA